jgi:hypothetical protein
MADQVTSGTVPGAMSGPSGLDPQQAGLAPSGTSVSTPGAHESFHGRPVSWVAVGIIITGFIIGGAALVAGPTWWLFWTGVGIVVIGALFGAATRIFDDWY